MCLPGVPVHSSEMTTLARPVRPVRASPRTTRTLPALAPVGAIRHRASGQPEPPGRPRRPNRAIHESPTGPRRCTTRRTRRLGGRIRRQLGDQWQKGVSSARRPVRPAGRLTYLLGLHADGRVPINPKLGAHVLDPIALLVRSHHHPKSSAPVPLGGATARRGCPQGRESSLG